ncbi:MAG TPA: hypothetical protein VLY65_00420 [Nitrososphaerales archaeon]|nr:hypothetical protein [Nitrososphaerales archaeon]
MKRAASAGRKKKVPKINEKEFVMSTLEEATGVHFEIIEPHVGFPLPAERVEWFMRCRDKDDIAKAPYLNTVWKERRVGIWLESLALGDTIGWIEIAYGEDRMNQSLDIDYSRFDDASFRRDFEQKYPIVMERVKKYEGDVSRIGKKRRVHLELRRVGSRGMLVFFIAALVEKRATPASLGAAILKSIEAMKEAYEAVSQD